MRRVMHHNMTQERAIKWRQCHFGAFISNALLECINAVGGEGSKPQPAATTGR
jgi:hypothetical protein